MTQIRLLGILSTEIIHQWPFIEGRELRFLLHKSSSLEPGAEGLALAFLRWAVDERKTISLQCEFELPDNENDFYSTLLSSIFGYALIRVCKEAFFSRSPEDRIKELRAFSGQTYDLHEGIVGRGDEVRLIAFDPRRSIPRALLTSPESLDQMGLPLPSAFQIDIRRILGGMGLTEIASPSTFTTIIRFVHELFVNTVQHGLPSREPVAVHSTRGISLTKILFTPAQLVSRDMSAELLEFLKRVAEMQSRQTSLRVVCISVMDMGDGIQNTLPSKEGETEGARLLRAFQLGESRKNSGAIERGAGLDRVVKVAHRLGARLQVTSGSRRIVKDFSLGEDKLPDLSDVTEFELPQHLSGGTTVDLFVPVYARDLDQRVLGL